MEENKNQELAQQQLEQEEKSAFDFQAIYSAIILNWKWFVLSLIICIGSAAIYLRYATPIYQAYAQMLIKSEDGNRGGRSSLINSANLGMISNSAGIDNEMVLLKSVSLAEQAVRKLKLYTTYTETRLNAVYSVFTNFLYLSILVSVTIFFITFSTLILFIILTRSKHPTTLPKILKPLLSSISIGSYFLFREISWIPSSLSIYFLQ